MEPLLQVRDLHVDYLSDGAPPSSVLRGISFSAGKGESIGLLGESGCGKSTLALAILGLLPASARITCGSICFQERELVGLPERAMETIRGAALSLIFQDPSSALHPILRVGTQIADVVAAHHRDWSRRRCRDVAAIALHEVGLTDGGRFYASYPHQLSGGQRQRVAIAQALAGRPALLIADEPTSSLDSTVQAEILTLLKSLRQERTLSLLLISHNPAVLAEIADRVLVIYAGQVVEDGSAPEVLASPLHPFTGALLRCLPRARQHNQVPQLSGIAGGPADPAETSTGCVFATRCAERMEICSTRMPAAVQPETGYSVRCFKYGG